MPSLLSPESRCALCGFALMLFCAPWAQAETMVLQTSQIRSLGIETATIAELGNAQGSRLPARVLVPNEQMRVVTAPVGGVVEMLAVAPGDSVKRGQVLANLASPQALELQRDVLQSGSQAQLLQQSLKRDETLFSEGLIPESRLQATRAAASQAATLATERKQGLALAGVTPGKLGGPLQLVAPIDGVVLEQGVQTGQRVDGAALIYRIARLSPLWLEIQAPVDVAATLKPGATLRIADTDIDARLLAVGRAIDPASQTVLLRAEVHKGAENLRPGQVVEVALNTVGEAQRITVPATALVRNANQTFVFVVRKADAQALRIEPQAVRVLGQGGNSAQIDGLEAHSRIVIKGASALKAIMSGVGGQ